jgi:hypothetical protein
MKEANSTIHNFNRENQSGSFKAVSPANIIYNTELNPACTSQTQPPKHKGKPNNKPTRTAERINDGTTNSLLISSPYSTFTKSEMPKLMIAAQYGVHCVHIGHCLWIKVEKLKLPFSFTAATS